MRNRARITAGMPGGAPCAAGEDGMKRGRPRKYPERNAAEELEKLVKRACEAAREGFDDRKERDDGLPTIAGIAEEMGMTAVKVRKLLITGNYYTSAVEREIRQRKEDGESIGAIMAATGLGMASIYSYLPYQRGAYALEEPGAFSEQGRRYRERKRTAGALRERISAFGLDATGEERLWEAVIAFQGYPFQTSGRGSREGVRFTYQVSAPGGKGGHGHPGKEIPGFGNEMIVSGKEKRISRSSVNLALRNGLSVQEKEGCVSGPKKLGAPGAGSYLYPLFLRMGIIRDEQSKQGNGDEDLSGTEPD